MEDQLANLDLQLSQVRSRISELETQLEIHRTNEKHIIKSINKLKSTYDNIDHFPVESKSFGIKIPSKYRFKHLNSSGTLIYVLRYSGYLFTYSNFVDSTCSYSFQIQENGLLLNNYVQQLDLPNQYLLVQLYYAGPELITDCSFREARLLDFPQVMERSKLLFGDYWCEDLMFGIMVFYYMFRLLFQREKYYIEEYAGLDKMFKTLINN